MSSKVIKLTSMAMCFIFVFQLFAIQAEAATRVYWYKKMTGGDRIFYWVDSGVEYTSQIGTAEVEIEIPAAGFSNPMKMTKTTTKSSSKMDFYQYYDPSSNTIAYTCLYKANENTPMKVEDLDVYDWYWGEIQLNKSRMDARTSDKQVVTIVHEMLHVYGGKDTYEDDQIWSIMYGTDDSTATGVTSDANAFLNDKYSE